MEPMRVFDKLLFFVHIVPSKYVGTAQERLPGFSERAGMRRINPLIYEGAWGDVPRGRKPVFLYVRTRAT